MLSDSIDPVGKEGNIANMNSSVFALRYVRYERFHFFSRLKQQEQK